jgi:hypothetical protein
MIINACMKLTSHQAHKTFLKMRIAKPLMGKIDSCLAELDKDFENVRALAEATEHRRNRERQLKDERIREGECLNLAT